MANHFLIFAVDDAPASRVLFETTLSNDYVIQTFESSEACLARLEAQAPDLFLLDVGLPGMDGYAFCRAIREQAGTRDVPVIFISGLDDLESRLKGYDAGGQDFIVKPFKVAELKQKIEVLRRNVEARRQLERQATDSDTLATLVLSNLDEYAVLVKFLRDINLGTTSREVADALQELLCNFNLNGALQLRVGGEVMTEGADGASHPLEESVIRLIRGGDRIVTFSSRAGFNFEHLTVLVNNMPVADAERCGRLRDHLAIAVESVDGRLAALEAAARNDRTQSGLGQIAGRISVLLEDFREKFSRGQMRATTLAHQLPFEVTSSIAHLGLSESQEERIEKIVERQARDLVKAVDLSAEVDAALRELEGELRRLLAG